MMTDPIADMLTRIRNANAIERPYVEMPATKFKVAIAEVLREEGYITGYEVGKMIADEEGNQAFRPVPLTEAKVILRVALKYGEDGEKVIRSIQRSSKPGLRVYKPADRLPRVLDGLGIAIISTSRGVMSDRKARRLRLGGELICQVW